MIQLKYKFKYLGAYNNIDTNEIDRIFKLFNLNEFGNKPYSKYSLGMKQGYII